MVAMVMDPLSAAILDKRVGVTGPPHYSCCVTLTLATRHAHAHAHARTHARTEEGLHSLREYKIHE